MEKKNFEISEKIRKEMNYLLMNASSIKVYETSETGIIFKINNFLYVIRINEINILKILGVCNDITNFSHGYYTYHPKDSKLNYYLRRTMCITHKNVPFNFSNFTCDSIIEKIKTNLDNMTL